MKNWGVLVVMAVVLSFAGSATAQAADERCTTNTAYSAAILESGKPEVVRTSYETREGTPQRTLYFPNGGYLVTVCRSAGRVDENHYERKRYADGSYRYVSTAHATRDGDDGEVTIPEFADPVDAKPSKPPTATPAQQAVARRGVSLQRTARKRAAVRAPGRRALLTRFRSKPPKRIAPRHHLTNKCIHNDGGVNGSYWPSRHISYQTALGGANWQRTRVADGIWTWTGTLNYCGWPQTPRLSASWAGDIQHLVWGDDGVSQVG